MFSLGALYGFATFYGLKKFQKPIKKAAVMTTSQLFNLADCTKEVAYNVKEVMEDIIAEAQYENMKRQQMMTSELSDSSMLEDANNDMDNSY